MLLFRGAYGGKEELVALEYARLDVADGSTDGYAAVLDGHKPKQTPGLHGLTVEEHTNVQAAIALQRAKQKAKSRKGGVLPYFLAFDLLALAMLLVVWTCAYLIPRGLDAGDFLFWSSLYNMKILYGLLSFPWLIFQIPIFGEALHEASVTGYNQSGQLVAKLFTSSRLALYKRAYPNDKFYDSTAYNELWVERQELNLDSRELQVGPGWRDRECEHEISSLE